MTDQIPDVPVKPTRRTITQRVSVVWLVPFAALLIALGVAWQSYADRGPLIEISFDDASGISANETQLRYRDVTVGLVESVGFSEAFDKVVVSVRLDRAVADYVDDSSAFWVVRPEVTAQGVTGLDTVLSGVFIQGLWDTEAGGLQDSFSGLETAPLMGRGQEGLEFTLQTGADTLSGNVPILYRGVEVGRVGPAEIAADGLTVTADAVIFAPYDRLVTDETRFWDTSGVNFSIGPSGAEVDFKSLASLIGGGVTFDTFLAGGRIARQGQAFDVYATESLARNSLANRADGPTVEVVSIFEGDVTGLATGAAVELNGLRIGEVTGFSGLVDPLYFGDNNVRMRTVMSIQPSRLGLLGDQGVDAALDFLEGQVQRGMRVRLATANLLTGGLKVQFVFEENPTPAEMDFSIAPHPRLPVTDADIADVSASAQGTLDRINDLPVEELFASVITLLDNTSVLIGSPDVQQTPGDLRALMTDVRGVVTSEGIQDLPVQLGTLMAELELTVTEARGLIATFQEADAVERVLAAIDAVEDAAGGVSASIAGVPALIERIDAVAATAAELPLEDLVEEVTALIETADALIGTEDARQLPAALNGALDELRDVLAELREGGVIENANATLASASAAADQIAAAADTLPALVAQINAVLSQAGTTLDGFSENAAVIRDSRAALREISRAAEAVSSLARTIERRPNSILLGR